VGLWWVGLRRQRGQHHGHDKYATLMGIGAAESKNGAEGEQTSLESGVLLVSQSDSGAGENGGRKEVDHKATSRAADSNGDIDALRLWFWGGGGDGERTLREEEDRRRHTYSRRSGREGDGEGTERFERKEQEQDFFPRDQW
jgi:hypothetical protein